jgi:CRISPR-associated protein (TIGR02710 family)
LENPLVVFGDLELEKVKEAFNLLDFAGAEKILDRLEKTADDVRLVQTLTLITRSYAYLDSFHFKEATEQIRNLFTFQSKRSFPHVEKNLEFYLQFLSILENKDNEKHYPYLSLHLFFSGTRFEKRGRYDLAIFLMYRLIELIFSALLDERYEIDHSSPDYKRAPQINKEIFNKKFSEIIGRPSHRELPTKLALMDQAVILNILGEKVTKILNFKKLRDAIKLRNNSIFAHGEAVLAEEDYKKIQRIARQLLEEFLKVKNLGMVEDFRHHFEFPII